MLLSKKPGHMWNHTDSMYLTGLLYVIGDCEALSASMYYGCPSFTTIIAELNLGEGLWRPLHTFFNFSKFVFLLVITSDWKASATFLKDFIFLMKVTYSLWQLNWQGSFFNAEPVIYRQ